MSPSPSSLSRRTFLTATGAIGAAALTACSDLTPGASTSGASSAAPVSTAVPVGKKITLVVADAEFRVGV
ncbi:hypothetical protein AB0H86_21195 [Streptomyces sp. NPDC050997]|uniref:hypothetical protein n=1 Tax=Streptomyces sp. NPDC050997 TaxID=3155519 RepID=UPI003428BE70